MSFHATDAAMMIGVLVVMLTMLWSVGKLARKFDISPELKRKIVHVTTGLASLSFPWLFSNPLPVMIMIAISLVTMAILRISFISQHSISKALHDVQRTSYGEFYLLLAVGFLFMCSQDNPVLYVLPLTVIALSDTASALIGTTYGRAHFTVAGGRKSLEGGVAFFIVTLLVSLILLMLLTEAADLNVIFLSIMVAAFCTLVESDSWKGLDNIFVPVGAFVLLAQFIDAPPMQLVIYLAVMSAFIGLIHQFSHVLCLTKHGGRAYGLLIILMVIGTPDNHALFPLIALATHLLARKSHPSQSPNRDLEMIAVTAMVAMLWMFAENLISRSSVDLFNLTFASVSLIFVGLTFDQDKRWLTLPAAVAIGALYIWQTSSITTISSVSLGNPFVLPVLSIGLTTVIIILKPVIFDRFRSLKGYGLASIVPVLTFIFVGMLSWA